MILVTTVLFTIMLYTACGANKEARYNGPDVYVAGYRYDGEKSIATIWKNGKIQPFPVPKGCVARGIFVSDKDVYVAGDVYRAIDGSNDARLWKNGAEQPLAGVKQLLFGANGSYANAVYVSGNDVYVLGYTRSGATATVWKNNAVQYLIDPEGNYVRKIFVAGDDVYVGGYDVAGALAKLWKNGAVHPLQDAPASLTIRPKHTTDNNTFVFGNDMYEAGFEFRGEGQRHSAKLWKNGMEQPLAGAVCNSSALSVFVK